MRFLALLLLLAGIALPARALTVFAAASLTNALQDIGTLWQAAGHTKIRFVFDSSGTLARQIEHGGPANIFISADQRWMDDAATKSAIVPQSRFDLVGNTLVLVEPKASLKPVDLTPGVTFDSILGAGGRLAVGDPVSVPAGIYAKQALTRLGLWPALAHRLAPAESVRAALRLVEVGEAPAGIVYGTDVKIAKSLAVAGTFPPETHDPIVYPAAIVRLGDTREAQDFLTFLHSPDAKVVFLHYGFTVL